MGCACNGGASCGGGDATCVGGGSWDGWEAQPSHLGWAAKTMSPSAPAVLRQPAKVNPSAGLAADVRPSSSTWGNSVGQMFSMPRGGQSDPATPRLYAFPGDDNVPDPWLDGWWGMYNCLTQQACDEYLSSCMMFWNSTSVTWSLMMEAAECTSTGCVLAQYSCSGGTWNWESYECQVDGECRVECSGDCG